MNCNLAQAYIDKYIDEDISEEEQKSLMEHLDQCQSCKTEFEMLTEVVGLCREIEEVDLPVGFQEELHQKLVQEVENKYGLQNKPVENKKRPIRWRRYTSLAAGLVVCALLLYGGFDDLKGNLTDGGTQTADSAPSPKMTAPSEQMEQKAEQKQEDQAQASVNEPKIQGETEGETPMAKPEKEVPKVPQKSKAVAAPRQETKKQEPVEDNDLESTNTEEAGAGGAENEMENQPMLASEVPNDHKTDDAIVGADNNLAGELPSLYMRSANKNTTELTIETKQFNTTVKDIKSFIEANGGSILNENLSQNDDGNMLYLEIEIPKDEEDLFYQKIKGLGNVIHESYVDESNTIELTILETK